MTTFSYVALEPDGRKRTGRIEAADQGAAVAALASEGRFVTEIKEEKSKSGSQTTSVDRKGGRASRADLALYLRRMSDLSGAGLPLDRVLQVLVEQTENGQLAEATARALDEVRGGLPVSEALGRNTKLFPNIVTMTLAAGEASGQFAESCERLAELMEADVARRAQLISAMIYPAVLSGFSVLAVIFILVFVVPRMKDVFDGMGDALPVPTKILLALSDTITQNWIGVIGVLAALIVGARVYLATPAGQYSKDQFLMNAPLFGHLVRKAAVARYSQVMGTLVFGGVPILEAIRLSGLASGNKIFEAKNQQVEEEVREGIGIAQAMKNTGVFPPVLTNMVAVGEETGDLPRMLNRVSTSMDFEVRTGLTRLNSLLEPLILIFMGIVVGFIVLSIALPIFQAQDMVK